MTELKRFYVSERLISNKFDSVESEPAKKLEFSKRYNPPLISGDGNSSKYYVAVQNFSVSTYLPIFEFQSLKGAVDTDVGVYQIGNDVNNMKNIKYINNDLMNTNKKSDGYYYIYNIKNWIDMINSCLKNELSSKCRFDFTDQFVLNYKSNSNEKIFVNYKLYAKLGRNFQFKRVAKEIFELIRNEEKDVSIDGYLTNTIYPQSRNVSSIFDIKSIVITSGSLPIVDEYFPSENKEKTTDNNYRSILCSYPIAIQSIDDYMTFMYLPNTLRGIELKGSSKVDTLQLSFFWINQKNEFIPLMTKDSVSEIKLCFMAKDSYFS